MEPLLSLPQRSLLRRLVSRSFGSAEEAAEEICRVAREILGGDIVWVCSVESAEARIIAVDEGFPSGVTPGMCIPLDQTLCVRALAGTGPETARDLADSAYSDLAVVDQLGVRGYAMTPLWDDAGLAMGTLSVLDREPRAFTHNDLVVLDLLGGIFSREQQIDRVRVEDATRAAALATIDRRYRTLVEDLGDVIVEMGPAGQITYVNPAWVQLTGISLEEMSGKDMMEQVHPEDRALAAEHMAEALGGAETAGVEAAREVRFLAADGSLRWMSVRGRMLQDSAGQMVGFLGILHDVTGRVKAENAIRVALAEAEEARDQAERASRAKSEFLSRMSHELRTPLNAILGFGQLLELTDLAAEEAENVDHILRAGRHLLDLINEVLDVVRVESGALSLSLEPVDLGEVAADSLDLVRPAAATRGISLRIPRRFDGAAVVADRQRLKQILVNLLSNAVKYNNEGGDVIVSWAVHEADASEPAPDAGHGWLRVSVRDTGRGIPAHRLEDVFTPFERLGAEGSDIEGTGVGLSLTRTLVAALGGRIGVSSEVGQGSTFWVDLPAAQLPVADAVPEESAPGLTRTVLYVEDNPSNVTLVRRVLARRPHLRLEVVQDGAEAIEAAQRLLPDLVLLDLHLPGMDGAAILTALRGADDDRLCKAPIVMLTADLTVGTERRMLEAGATLFLSKPIDVHRLLAVVDDHLPQP